MRPPYDRLLDDEMQAFVRETEAFDAPPGSDIAAVRAAYDAMCAHFRAARPAGLAVRDETIGGVACRRYGAGDVTVLYLHGGGFVMGGLDSHDDVCAEIAERTGCTVVSADYGLSPEHPHPTAYDDALAVFDALRGPVVLCGDSAGATLAASIAQVRKDAAGVALIYPGLGAGAGTPSMLEHAEAPLLTRAEVLAYSGIRGGSDDDPTHRPLAATDLSGHPPIFVSGASCDPLNDDGAVYCERVRAAGGEAEFVSEPGLVHGHLRARHRSKRAREAFDRIVASVERFAQT